MWIFQNDAFVSIVKHNEYEDVLIVRARVEGDLERFFRGAIDPNADVFETPDADYRYRTFMPRRIVAHALQGAVADLRYGNFKDSVAKDDAARKGVYFEVWQAALRLQAGRLLGALRGWVPGDLEDDPDDPLPF